MMEFNSKEITTCFGQQRPSSGYYNFAHSITYMPILQGDAEISSSLRVTVSLVTRNDDEISASPRNIGIYMIL